jgi:RNA polymerase sigma-70 factor (family 1)
LRAEASNNLDYFISFQKGEEKGFAYYFKLHHKPLLYFATRLVKDSALAEDVVEECFIKFFEKRETLQSPGTVKGFLYTIVRNSCLEQIEKLKVRQGHHSKIEYLQNITESTIAEALIRTETLAIIYRAIEQLPPASQRVFKLFYLEGKSYDEIAEKLNRSKNTIKNQKKHALILLRKKLLFIVVLQLTAALLQ